MPLLRTAPFPMWVNRSTIGFAGASKRYGIIHFHQGGKTVEIQLLYCFQAHLIILQNNVQLTVIILKLCTSETSLTISMPVLV